jgi:hypothetical protein
MLFNYKKRKVTIFLLPNNREMLYLKLFLQSKILGLISLASLKRKVTILSGMLTGSKTS